MRWWSAGRAEVIQAQEKNCHEKLKENNTQNITHVTSTERLRDWLPEGRTIWRGVKERQYFWGSSKWDEWRQLWWLPRCSGHSWSHDTTAWSLLHSLWIQMMSPAQDDSTLIHDILASSFFFFFLFTVGGCRDVSAIFIHSECFGVSDTIVCSFTHMIHWQWPFHYMFTMCKF